MRKKPIIIRIVIIAGIIFFCNSHVIANKIYEWTDKNGVKNYSQVPPPSSEINVRQKDELKETAPDNNSLKKSRPSYLKSKKQIELEAFREKREKDQSDRDFENRKKNEAKLISQKIRISKEYSETLSQCSDKYWPDLKDIEECRRKTHQKYKKMLAEIEQKIINLYMQ